MKNIELKINKKELNRKYYKNLKIVIYSMWNVNNNKNMFRCGKYIINITDDFIGADTKYSIDFTNWIKRLSEFEPITELQLKNAIELVMWEKKTIEKKINKYYKMYLKRGYFYTKFKKIRDFLLDNDFIIRTNPWDNSTYEVLEWNRDYKENLWKTY